jgi:hypothetical protein
LAAPTFFPCATVRIITISKVIGVMRVFARLLYKLYSTRAKNKKILLKNCNLSLDSPQILPDTSEGSW